MLAFQLIQHPSLTCRCSLVVTRLKGDALVLSEESGGSWWRNFVVTVEKLFAPLGKVQKSLKHGWVDEGGKFVVARGSILDG
jgi:hypothetical protein